MTPTTYLPDQNPSPRGEQEETSQEEYVVAIVDVNTMVGKERRRRQHDEYVKDPQTPVLRCSSPAGGGLRSNFELNEAMPIPNKVETTEKYSSSTPVPTTTVLGIMATAFQTMS